jgi:hypothetical protein
VIAPQRTAPQWIASERTPFAHKLPRVIISGIGGLKLRDHSLQQREEFGAHLRHVALNVIDSEIVVGL